jgi:hypothetical protein
MGAPFDSDSVVVLYIGSEPRSGSTVLAALLGNHEGLFPVGEFRTVWQVLETDELCGCGEPFSSCQFWRRVGEKAFDGWDRVDVENMLKMDRRFARHRRIPSLLVSSLRWPRGADLDQYRQTLGRLYAGVKEVSGCSVIVDSTKDPPYALILRNVRKLDLRLVHLVRDSRGVAYSLTKTGIERPEYANHPELRGTSAGSRVPWRTALNWNVKNTIFHLMSLSQRHRVVKYESLMSQPTEELASILCLAHEGRTVPREVTQISQGFESLPFHTLGGNRVRFNRGSINLRADDEWRSKMSFSQKLIVGALTLPLLVAYGYVRVPPKFRSSIPRLASK